MLGLVAPLFRMISIVIGVSLSFSLAQAQSLESEFLSIQAEAKQLAGAPEDIAQRVVFLHAIFVESGQVHAFPEVALHGALWAHEFFSRKNMLNQLFVMRGFNKLQDQEVLLRKAAEFSEKLLKTNRQVFIDTYTNYYFSKRFGARPGASHFVPAPLLALLNRAHAMKDVTSTELQRNPGFLRELFESSLRNEQEKSVAPMVQSAVREFCVGKEFSDGRKLFENGEFVGFVRSQLCSGVLSLLLKPAVHFHYFPADVIFFFNDFSQSDERIHYALQSFDLAVKVGWSEVSRQIHTYGIDYPNEFFYNPVGYANGLKAKLLH